MTERLMSAFARTGVDGAVLERAMRGRCSHYMVKFRWTRGYMEFAVRHACRCAALKLGAALAHDVAVNHPQAFATSMAIQAFGYDAEGKHFRIKKTRFSRKEGVHYVRAK